MVTYKKLRNKAWFAIPMLIAEFLIIFVLLYLTIFRVVPIPVTPLMVYRPFDKQYDWVPFEKISPHMVRCAIVSEDPGFRDHRGFDFSALREAMEKNEEYEEEGSAKLVGGSTISQQTMKNILLWQARNYIRKGLEFPLTAAMEVFWTKKRIIEVYLNVIEMGKGIYGTEATAQFYFHKPAADLTVSEAASIVVTFPSPLKRNPTALSKGLQRKAAKRALWSTGAKVDESWWRTDEVSDRKQSKRKQ